MRVFDQKNYKSKLVNESMETVTIQKKEYEKLKRMESEVKYTKQQLQSWKSTAEILQNKEMMKDIKESLENIRKGKFWKSKY